MEDDPALRSLDRRALRTAGYAVNGVEDGFDGLQFIESTLPDLLVLDMGALGKAQWLSSSRG